MTRISSATEIQRDQQSIATHISRRMTVDPEVDRQESMHKVGSVYM